MTMHYKQIDRFKEKLWVLIKTYRYQLIFAAVIALGMASCHKSKPKVSVALLNSYEVKALPVHKTLHFSGTVQPLQEHSLTSPMEAIVESMPFHYGQLVKKGDVILTLNSNELQKQYNDTLTEYLKAKDSYTIAKAKFVGTQDLWNVGILSKNNYLSEKSSIATSRVALMQSTRKLTEMLEKMDDSSIKKISDLNLTDFDKVRKILSSNHNLIRIKATGDGVLLYPPKTGEDKTTRVTVGAAVKPGQVLGLVGDLQGISVEIDVPEIDIDKIHTGMAATVSGVAFGKHQLQGKVVAVNAQASATGSGGLPSFTAVVVVNALTPEQLQWIKIGMSAAIELKIESNNQLLVPIAAVKREKGNSIVLVQLANGRTEKRIITTGSAQADSVVVESGLEAGERVVYG